MVLCGTRKRKGACGMGMRSIMRGTRGKATVQVTATMHRSRDAPVAAAPGAPSPQSASDGESKIRGSLGISLARSIHFDHSYRYPQKPATLFLPAFGIFCLPPKAPLSGCVAFIT